MNIFHYVSQDHSTRRQIHSPPRRFVDSGKLVSYVKQSVGPLILELITIPSSQIQYEVVAKQF
jgi:hypothetical protein